MTREEFWKKFTNREVAVHTPKKEQFLSLLKECRGRGIQVNMQDACYYEYETETYIGIQKKSALNIIDQLISNSVGFLDKWTVYGTKEDFACALREIIEYDEIFKEDRPFPIITVTCDGKKTTAQMITDEKMVKEVHARCAPSDTFHYEKGVKLAINRLFDNRKVVKQKSYQVGDKVKIVDEWKGYLHNHFGAMDRWLGKTMTIADCSLGYKMSEDDRVWYWHDEMIEGKVINDGK